MNLITAFVFILVACLQLSCDQNTVAERKAHKSRNYYISNEGDDTNDGSKATPWKTIVRLNMAYLASGDTIFLKGAEVFDGTLLLKNVWGLKDRPVVITSYGGGTAVINARDSIAVQLDRSLYIEISRLILLGSGRKDGNATDGLAVSNSSNIKLDSLDITGFRNAGLGVYSSDNVRITHINARENGYAGISVMGGKDAFKKDCHTIYIGHCLAENNPGSPVILDNHSGNGIIAGYCTRVMIEYSVATNNGWDMPRIGNGPVGIWLFEADSSVIQYCTSHHNKTSNGGEDGGGYDLDGGVTNSVIQYCESYDNAGSGFGLFQYRSATPWYNNTIQYNTSRNDGLISAAHAGVYIWNEQGDSAKFRDCSFHDNIIYNASAAALSFASLSMRSGFNFYNNLLTGKGQTITDHGAPSNDRFSGNTVKAL